ncbi:molybdopterin cofactor-binding domain-containing protein [Phenylobacterium sp.]|uniref:molybdopterin cofactor-binding domain-containing protein n=1 Tax=Phenylobacterium sp. TaxID=1871053 RepID=UPI00289EBA58|nr:molybdopterin cofactor-binding domain-containing protein [Phenylobacterium sp.]
MGAERGVDPSVPQSWIEILPDNTIHLRTGNSDFGQGTVYTAYRQIVAEELNTTVEAITTVITGDTDRTPDGGGSYGFLKSGSPNLKKAAAYTYQAILDLAAEHFGVPRDRLTVTNGVIQAGAQQISYGELVKGRDLKLTIQVTEHWPSGLQIVGNPPTKPASEYKIIGRSTPNSAVTEKVTAKAQWITDVRLPGMLHARIVRPPTLGSSLIKAAAVDRTLFPESQVVVKGNLVAVVSPDEWQTIQAAEQVSGSTTWTDWKGLPGDAHLYEALRKLDWKSTPVMMGEGTTSDLVEGQGRKLKASYFMPYLKHAPIGPTVAVADVQPHLATVYAHTQNAQMLRRQIAQMLEIPIEQVVVRTFTGPGHYGRSNGGNAGAEDEAAILSRELRRPVRVQWSRAEDMQWSTQSSPGFSDIEIHLDEVGRMTSYQADHHMPARNDNRLIGAVLAGLPTLAPPSETPAENGQLTSNPLWDRWVYGRTTAIAERSHGARQIGQDTSPIGVGLRDHSLRTPGQFHQNFPRELAISEAAAMAGADALQFRIDHTTNPRMVDVLTAVRDASGWKSRPSPAPRKDAQAAKTRRGRGVSALFRNETYWACVCEILVDCATGVVEVTKCVAAVDPGIVINPHQLKLQVAGGMTMGLSHALKEAVSFDERAVTTTDWIGYPILTMAETPEIEVVLINRPETGVYGGGSEAANALAAPAAAAAVHDAIGHFPRRIPLTPDHILALLGRAATA